ALHEGNEKFERSLRFIATRRREECKVFAETDRQGLGSLGDEAKRRGLWPVAGRDTLSRRAAVNRQITGKIPETGRFSRRFPCACDQNPVLILLVPSRMCVYVERLFRFA